MSVTVFVIVAVLLVLVVLAVLLRPLWQSTGVDTDTLAVNRALYLERAAELEQWLANGQIDAEAKARLDTENGRRLLADADGEVRAAAGAVRRPLVIVLTLLLPIAAALLYWQLGRFTAVRDWHELQQSDVSQGNRNMIDMLLVLRTRLQDDPEDMEGWYLLGRSYLSVDRPQEALQAFDQARRLAPKEPDYLVAYAQTLRMVEQDDSLPEVDRLLASALQQDPNHEGARLLTAYRDMETGRFEQAIAAFEALRRNRGDDAESAAMLDKVIADARAAQQASEAASVPAPMGSASPASPNIGKVAAPSSNLTVSVTLAPALKAKLSPTARVFVFARGESGAGLPVAVSVLPATGLPATITLSDANAMNPAVKLSDQQRVSLVARVSMAGTVEPAKGDLQGKVELFDWRQSPSQNLLIDTEL